jgi:hypothetical protein
VIVYIIPVAALVLALMWNRWARRPEKPMDPMSQVQAYQRMVDALSEPEAAPPAVRAPPRPGRRGQRSE